MLNTAVDPFRGRIAQVVAEVCHDVIPVAFEHADDSLNRLPSGRHSLAAPLLEVSHSIGLVRALPQRPEKLFDLAVCVSDALKSLKQLAHLHGTFSIP